MWKNQRNTSNNQANYSNFSDKIDLNEIKSLSEGELLSHFIKNLQYDQQSGKRNGYYKKSHKNDSI